MVAALFSVIWINANDQSWWWGEVPLLAACLLVGWGMRSWAAVPLALVPVFLAIPFGYPNDYVGEDPLPIWRVELIFSAIYGLLIVAGMAARRINEKAG